jgi:hypothetical protein
MYDIPRSDDRCLQEDDVTDPFAYPAIYDSAGYGSAVGQRRFIRATRVRLLALVAAALGGAMAWRVGTVDLFGWLALVAFLLALGAGFYILATEPEQLWYDGRTAVESAKTLAWRYAVGGDPFPLDLEPRAADLLLLDRLDEILTNLGKIPPPAPGTSSQQITESMRHLRNAPFAQRKAAYIKDRIVDQETWYGDKASHNDKRAHLFTWTAICLEFTGVIGAVLKAFSVVNVDLLGALSAAAAGLTAWGQARQYRNNSRAYSIAYHELASIRSELESIDETEWARYVEEAESAVSREHTLWRASKGIAVPAARRRPRRPV